MIQELNQDGSVAPSSAPSLELENNNQLATCSKETDTIISSVTTKSPTKRAFEVEKYKNFLLKPLETKRMKPSETLSKVRDFLPLLKESTTRLIDDSKVNPDAFNMETVADDDEQHIEMNLAYVLESSESDSDDSDDDDDDSEEDDEGEDEIGATTDLNSIGLDIKVKDPSQLNLKLTSGTSGKKPMIKIIDDGEFTEAKKENGSDL